MSIKAILSRCDILPGDFILLSEFQEQGILFLEEWHANDQENIVTELLTSGYLDSDYLSSDSSSFDSSFDTDIGYDCDNDIGAEEYECDRKYDYIQDENKNLSNPISSTNDIIAVHGHDNDQSVQQREEITDSETTVDDGNNDGNNPQGLSMFINMNQLQQEISLFGDGKMNNNMNIDNNDDETSLSDFDDYGNDSETSIGLFISIRYLLCLVLHADITTMITMIQNGSISSNDMLLHTKYI